MAVHVAGIVCQAVHSHLRRHAAAEAMRLALLSASWRRIWDWASRRPRGGFAAPSPKFAAKHWCMPRQVVLGEEWSGLPDPRAAAAGACSPGLQDTSGSTVASSNAAASPDAAETAAEPGESVRGGITAAGGLTGRPGRRSAPAVLRAESYRGDCCMGAIQRAAGQVRRGLRSLRHHNGAGARDIVKMMLSAVF